jgi:alpha-tubulin suppressor-like RCC1 family protein
VTAVAIPRIGGLGLLMCALRQDSRVFCWIDQAFMGPAWEVEGVGEVISLAAGASHACAVGADGRLWCWGNGTSGQLGNGSVASHPRDPVEVVSLAGRARKVAVGMDHTCALLDDGSVWCWGENNFGQLGDGTTSAHPAPVPVWGASHDVRSIAAYIGETCAVRGDGRVACWGYFDHEGVPTPKDVPGIDSAVEIALSAQACALRTDGSVLCWRGGAAPETVFDSNTHAVAMDTSERATCAVRQDGSVVCTPANSPTAAG